MNPDSANDINHSPPGSPFVAPDSIVRRIWGDGDIMLFVFAGAAAEFALNRAVDWLFFTGSLPADPMARLFSTARFVREIVFVEESVARRTMDRIRGIHQSIESERGEQIPEWAHRDVLYLLIDYSERAYRLLYRSLTKAEKDELYRVFWRVGDALRIPELPGSYDEWQQDRARHLRQDLAYSPYTSELYTSYLRQLGAWRWHILRQVQALLAPEFVRQMLNLRPWPGMRYLLRAYRPLVRIGLRPLIRRLIVPREYIGQIRQMDETASAAS